MPFIQVTTNSGPIAFAYDISTPTSTSADSIDANLPTVLFLHPSYDSRYTWHSQFADRQLRRFNLVALDMRGYGETGGLVPSTHSQEHVAQDIAQFMDALDLPPCHIVGMSIGSMIALQLAISSPKHTLSLSLIGPLGLEERKDVAEGRQEVFDCWVSGFKDGKLVDTSALEHAAFGGVQLAFNGKKSQLTDALVLLSMELAKKNWSPAGFDACQLLTVDFFAARGKYVKDSLSRVLCPVKLIHCMEDITFSLDDANLFLKQLQAAGVDVSLALIEGAPHYGAVTHAADINPILYEFIAAQIKTSVPPAPQDVTSPFEARLIQYGLEKEDSSDDDIQIVDNAT
ncbi:Alpha/Beta hydrolase protein [Mycena floridula]|nr:Alpha/Beta hydrolase protein [Mycena floridula]